MIFAGYRVVAGKISRRWRCVLTGIRVCSGYLCCLSMVAGFYCWRLCDTRAIRPLRGRPLTLHPLPPSVLTHGGGEGMFFSTPAPEEGIQFLEGELPPGGAAVVALVGALAGFHLAQEGVHFGQGEAFASAHGGVAGQR